MFTIKYMEHWNGATLTHSIAEVSATKTLEIGLFEFLPNQPMILVCVVQNKMHLYQLRLVVNLVTNATNNARDKVLKTCRIWLIEANLDRQGQWWNCTCMRMGLVVPTVHNQKVAPSIFFFVVCFSWKFIFEGITFPIKKTQA